MTGCENTPWFGPLSAVCHISCKVGADVGLNPVPPLTKPVRSLPCKYVVQPDDVPEVMLKAAEVAAVYEGVLEAVSV